MSFERSTSRPALDANCVAVSTFRRNRVQDATIWAANRVAQGLHSTFGPRPENAFGILMYHRVAERTPGVSTPTGNVTPSRFRQQLSGLLEQGFEAWSLGRLVAAVAGRQRVPSNVFAVTFDDGYENNLLHALPILEELRVPATIYVATAYLDSDEPFPFDNWDGAGAASVPAVSWRPLSSRQCEELARHELIELGAHTHSHAAFKEDLAPLEHDLALNLSILREQFGVSRPTFAYPYGSVGREMVDCVRTMAIAAAVTTRAERIRPGADRYAWGRFTSDQRDTAATLAAKLNGWYEPIATFLRAVKRPVSAMIPGGLAELVPATRPSMSSVDR